MSIHPLQCNPDCRGGMCGRCLDTYSLTASSALNLLLLMACVRPDNFTCSHNKLWQQCERVVLIASKQSLYVCWSQGTHMIMGGMMIVKKGTKGVQFQFTEDFFGDHPEYGRVSQTHSNGAFNNTCPMPDFSSFLPRHSLIMTVFPF